MKTETFGLLALESTNVVMKLEKELLEKNLRVRVIPVPKEVTANCGLSIKFFLEEADLVRSCVEGNQVTGDYYKVTKTGLKKQVEKL